MVHAHAVQGWAHAWGMGLCRGVVPTLQCRCGGAVLTVTGGHFAAQAAGRALRFAHRKLGTIGIFCGNGGFRLWRHIICGMEFLWAGSRALETGACWLAVARVGPGLQAPSWAVTGLRCPTQRVLPMGVYCAAGIVAEASPSEDRLSSPDGAAGGGRCWRQGLACRLVLGPARQGVATVE